MDYGIWNDKGKPYAKKRNPKNVHSLQEFVKSVLLEVQNTEGKKKKYSKTKFSNQSVQLFLSFVLNLYSAELSRNVFSCSYNGFNMAQISSRFRNTST